MRRFGLTALLAVSMALITLPACCYVTEIKLDGYSQRNKTTWSFQDLVDSSVSIAILDSNGNPQAGGSGTWLPGGRVLTARHVVERAGDRQIVVLDEYETKRSNAVILKMGAEDDAADDWAVLVCEKPFGVPANLPEIGDLLIPKYSKSWVVGFPLWSKVAIITEGRFQGKEHGLLRITAPIVYGNSGGGCFASASGKPVLIGIPVRLHLSGGPICHMGLCVDVQGLVDRGIL